MFKKYLQKAEDEKIKWEKREAVAQVATTVVIGAAVGLVAGILLAPKSGKEIREGVSKKTKDVLVKGKSIFHNIQTKFKK